MRKEFYISFFLILLTQGVFAQQLKTKKAGNAFLKALVAFRQKDYKTTENELSKSLRLDSTQVKTWLLKAEAEEEQGHAMKAIYAYAKVVKLDKTGIPKAYYSLGNLQFKKGEYKDAVVSLSTFLGLPSKVSAGLLNKATLLLKSARFARFALQHPTPVLIKALNPYINTSAEEYINFVNEDKTRLVFTRKYPDADKSNKGNLYKEQFFKTTKTNSSDWQLPLSMVFRWAKAFNMGGLNLSPDGRQMYFTGCYWPGGYGGCDIYQSDLRGKNWQTPKNVGEPVNTAAWDSQPCISADGHQLYFTSKRPGGKGGTDIWMSTKGPSGKWLSPVNLGDSINTDGDEMAPFLSADNQTLYFSSNGWPGMGALDLFVSRKNKSGHWSRPQNLGYPVNTKSDEMNLFVSLDGSEAWISSNRAGNMDIYSFKTYFLMQPQATFFVEGKVVDAKTEMALKAKVVVSDLKQQSVIDSTWSDKADGHFFIVLHPGKEVAFHIFKKGYLFYSGHFDLSRYSGQKSVSAVFRLQPVQNGARMRLENILFDFDRFTLRPEAYAELNLLAKLLRQNPETKILIAGYTDSVGTAKHNLKLSTNRAKVIYEYLKNKGIAPGRMIFKGFGSKYPLNNNQTEEERAQNRRTEIIIR